MRAFTPKTTAPADFGSLLVFRGEISLPLLAEIGAQRILTLRLGLDVRIGGT